MLNLTWLGLERVPKHKLADAFMPVTDASVILFVIKKEKMASTAHLKLKLFFLTIAVEVRYVYIASHSTSSTYC